MLFKGQNFYNIPYTQIKYIYRSEVKEGGYFVSVQ